MATRRGITLLEVTIAIVTLSIGFTALIRIWMGLIALVGSGRRWTLMTAAASAELERLERLYRSGAPTCTVPPSGFTYTPDGVGLTWTTVDSAGQLGVEIEVRAREGRAVMVDTVATVVPCR